MRATFPVPMTLADLYALPEDQCRHELMHGMLVREPLPGGRHGRVAARLVQRLGAFVEAHRLGVVLTCDTAFVLHRDPDTVRAPDVAFVERERYASFGDDTGALPGAPDLAIEVLSPSDAYSDVHAKVADYLAAGARQVWVVDPARSTITRYAELLAPRTFSEGETLTAPALLPGFELRVAEVFTR